MTALQKAKEKQRIYSETGIIRFGCPDRYGVGIKPESCTRDSGEVDKRKCKECWNQEVKP